MFKIIDGEIAKGELPSKQLCIFQLDR
ncbi:MAG: hypothetical protein ACKVQJ_14120 [Pyrinomonadaceae bacterium]